MGPCRQQRQRVLHRHRRHVHGVGHAQDDVLRPRHRNRPAQAQETQHPHARIQHVGTGEQAHVAKRRLPQTMHPQPFVAQGHGAHQQAAAEILHADDPGIVEHRGNLLGDGRLEPAGDAVARKHRAPRRGFAFHHPHRARPRQARQIAQRHRQIPRGDRRDALFHLPVPPPIEDPIDVDAAGPDREHRVDDALGHVRPARPRPRPGLARPELLLRQPRHRIDGAQVLELLRPRLTAIGPRRRLHPRFPLVFPGPGPSGARRHER